MKKLASIVIALSLFLVSVHATTSQGVDLTPSAKAAILIDYETGQILYEKNSSAKLYPASMTKMMSLLLVVEAIHNGKLSWDTEVTASAHASSMGGSQIFLETGEVMTVEDLYKASTVASANDAIVALAEKVGGSEENFAAMMNEKAEQLGLEQTHFVNATGLHDDNHYSCAKDMAAIGRALIKEQILAGQYEQADPHLSGDGRPEDRLHDSVDVLHHGDGQTRRSASDRRRDGRADARCPQQRSFRAFGLWIQHLRLSDRNGKRHAGNDDQGR